MKIDNLRKLVEQAEAMGAVTVSLNVQIELGPRCEALNPSELLTVAQAAKRFNLGARTIYRLVETGELRSARIGRAIRIKPSEFERYLAQPRKSKPGSLFD